jgi:hypothetical protein
MAKPAKPAKEGFMSDVSRNRGQARTVVTTVPFWLIGWLFTLGFTQPTFWKGVLDILIWPYFLGRALIH